jgi:hypothetical protein
VLDRDRTSHNWLAGLARCSPATLTRHLARLRQLHEIIYLRNHSLSRSKLLAQL